MQIRYLIERKQKHHSLWYWMPKDEYFIQGKWVKTPKALLSRSLGKDKVAAAGIAEDLYKKLTEWRKSQKEPLQHFSPGTLGWICAEYLKDERFHALKPATQKNNLYYVDKIKTKFGDAPLLGFTRVFALKYYRSFDKVRTAEEYVKIMRLLFSFARDLGQVQDNPFERLRIKRNAPRTTIWPDNLIKQLVDHCCENNRHSVAKAIMIATESSQRQTDVLRLGKPHYDGKKLRLKQSKTGKAVSIPVTQRLKPWLDEDNGHVTFVISEITKKPYAKSNFVEVFRELCNAAKIPSEYQFRDFRKNGLLNLYKAECTVAEAAAISGHTLSEAQNIINVYFIPDDDLADRAMKKVEAHRRKVERASAKLKKKVERD